MLTSPISVGLMIKLAITVVLFSNLRATWIAAMGSRNGRIDSATSSRGDLWRQIRGSVAPLGVAENPDRVLRLFGLRCVRGVAGLRGALL